MKTNLHLLAFHHSKFEIYHDLGIVTVFCVQL